MVKNPYKCGDKVIIVNAASTPPSIRLFRKNCREEVLTFSYVSYVHEEFGPLLIFKEYDGCGLWVCDVELAGGPW